MFIKLNLLKRTLRKKRTEILKLLIEMINIIFIPTEMLLFMQ